MRFTVIDRFEVWRASAWKLRSLACAIRLSITITCFYLIPRYSLQMLSGPFATELGETVPCRYWALEEKHAAFGHLAPGQLQTINNTSPLAVVALTAVAEPVCSVNNIRLLWEVPFALPPILGARNFILEIIVNLLRNSLRVDLLKLDGR